MTKSSREVEAIIALGVVLLQVMWTWRCLTR